MADWSFMNGIRIDCKLPKSLMQFYLKYSIVKMIILNRSAHVMSLPPPSEFFVQVYACLKAKNVDPHTICIHIRNDHLYYNTLYPH